ncbi:hypothetical protein AB7A53_006085 [Pseudomonas aeruginosa]|jgi:hypothetical protein|uniref:hypothetical protein n=1 Tax=Pseudomonas aeruginosa group TaxID=136841 RepID=UPI001046ABB6|nr:MULTISPECIES: hypothetical protein [Pseudomonas aeruginosa group]EJB8514941.1 hypothetical protein [Pseudomonas aeruginosa]EKB9389112.1 hypothetical protein [Pseudomonas aeruginosa]EKU4832181.1 hypothetical protein [Pseudomonas aeruginosa]EKU7804079.1 hypothetical protein [Pseudomonas aeruginosa]EKW2948369.1 hypothetical protein [Pseudomonas aeruginosa]
MEIAQFADLVSVAKVQPEQRRLRVYKSRPDFVVQGLANLACFQMTWAGTPMASAIFSASDGVPILGIRPQPEMNRTDVINANKRIISIPWVSTWKGSVELRSRALICRLGS